MGYKKVRKNNK